MTSSNNELKNFNSVTYSVAPTSDDSLTPTTEDGDDSEPVLTVFMSGHPNEDKYLSLPQQGPIL